MKACDFCVENSCPYCDPPPIYYLIDPMLTKPLLEPMYVDKNGTEIDFITWVNLFSNIDYRRVALDHFDTILVSSVWIGILPGPFEMLISTPGQPDIIKKFPTLESITRAHVDVLYELSSVFPPRTPDCLDVIEEDFPISQFH